jgi:ZIP family zinc transporter
VARLAGWNAVSEGQTLVLGFIAGGTILLGLAIARWGAPRPGLRQLLSALAIGILVFLLWDILSSAFLPLGEALGKLHDGSGGVGPVLGYSLLFFMGIGVGLLSLVYYERWLESHGKPRRFGPGAMAPNEIAARRVGIVDWSPARRLALLIASGIGLHNFGEGLAIGGSAAAGTLGLATVLVIGFALHNATEGFGIVAPLAAEEDRVSWRFLLLMAAIAGGPTVLGTLVGRQFTNDAISVVFLALAAGSVLYVVIQLVGLAHRANRKDLLYRGVLMGLAAGFITDMIVTLGGG